MAEWVGIVIFVVAILAVVMIHESGHFFTAKAFGIKVEEFFVGFGPRLWSTRRGETEYGVKAFPLGGYVRIAGMNPFQETPPEELPRTFGAKPIWQRALVIVAGPITHFAMAIVFLIVFFVAVGVQTPTKPLVDGVQRTLEGQVSPAAQAGLQKGDQILAIDGRPVGSADNFIAYTRAHVGQAIAITVLRDGRRTTVQATPILSNLDGKEVGRLGVILGEGRLKYNPPVAIGKAFVQTGSTTKEVVLQLGKIFGFSGLKRIGQLLAGSTPRQTTDVTSIYGGARLAGEAVQAGAWDFLFGILVVFNVFVGILNLVPLPPLDGGHLAVLAYEKIRGRKPDVRKLVPLTTAVAGFIVLLAVSLIYIDITNPLPNPFR
jgi:membrane-associated protease RseP (regulator of RpoE activity)